MLKQTSGCCPLRLSTHKTPSSFVRARTFTLKNSKLKNVFLCMNWSTEWIWTEVKGEEDLIFIKASSDKKEEVTVNIYLKRTLYKKFSKKFTQNLQSQSLPLQMYGGVCFQFLLWLWLWLCFRSDDGSWCRQLNGPCGSLKGLWLLKYIIWRLSQTFHCKLGRGLG